MNRADLGERAAGGEVGGDKNNKNQTADIWEQVGRRSVHRCCTDASEAEQAPPVIQGAGDPPESHPQPSHLLSHSPRVITGGARWAHDGCWETRTGI